MIPASTAPSPSTKRPRLRRAEPGPTHATGLSAPGREDLGPAVGTVNRPPQAHGTPAHDGAALLAGPVLEEGARGLLRQAGGRLEHGDLQWEIDVFEGALAGLIIAEIELPSENTDFPHPNWLGREVTDDRRYYNSSLAADGRPEDPEA